jgi:SAM-dependent methyltransferase
MTTLLTRKWRKYWSDKSTPLYGRDNTDFFAHYGNELRLILGQAGEYRSVLELGCGSGGLFAPLGFDQCEYTGVDFSAAMLENFFRRHPGVRLIEANAADFAEDRRYDLIFSSGLLQYFDASALQRHLDACRPMLSPSSAIVHAGLLWSRHKWLFRTGWGPGRPPAKRNRIQRTLRPWYSLYRERIGEWYSPQSIAAIAERQGYRCQFFGSVHFLYRFHVLLQPAA